MIRHLKPLLFLLAPIALAAQDVPPPADSTLAGITARGRLLAAYDVAAWHGTDAVIAKLSSPAGIEGFLARQDEKGIWHFLLGRLSKGKDSLLIVGRADQAGRPDSFVAAIPGTPSVGTDYELRAFRALKTVEADIGTSPRPFAGQYNSYVLPRADGSWLLFFLPAQSQVGVYPHGGDFRYEVSADGSAILSKFKMHNTVLMFGPPPPGNTSVMGAHTVVTADLPQESDVFLVLARAPQVPELITTAHFNYTIKIDGSITWVRRAGQE